MYMLCHWTGPGVPYLGSVLVLKHAAADRDFPDTLEATLSGTRGIVLFRAWSAI
jgi:hypothetical protein